MILVTVGTHPQGFERLVRPMDELAAGLDEPVIIQYGSSLYTPQHAKGFDFTSSQEMERLTAQARVVVCHAAAGAIIMAVNFNKPLVLIPRLKKYSEHFDDHQLQLARTLETQNKALVVYKASTDNLREAISRASPGLFSHIANKQLVQDLSAKFQQWDAPKKWQIEKPEPEPDL